MALDFDERQQKRSATMFMIYNLVMGTLWIGAGAFFLGHQYLGFRDIGLDKVLTTIFGVAALMYGIFRLYRGIRAARMR